MEELCYRFGPRLSGSQNLEIALDWILEEMEKDGVPLLSLEVNRDRYFWYHHTPADTPEKVDLDEYRECIASFAVIAYVLADMKTPLVRIAN